MPTDADSADGCGMASTTTSSATTRVPRPSGSVASKSKVSPTRNSSTTAGSGIRTGTAVSPGCPSSSPDPTRRTSVIGSPVAQRRCQHAPDRVGGGATRDAVRIDLDSQQILGVQQGASGEIARRRDQGGRLRWWGRRGLKTRGHGDAREQRGQPAPAQQDGAAYTLEGSADGIRCGTQFRRLRLAGHPMTLVRICLWCWRSSTGLVSRRRKRLLNLRVVSRLRKRLLNLRLRGCGRRRL